MKSGKSLRWLVLFLAPVLGGACIAEAAGPTQTPRIIVVTATGEAPGPDQQPEGQIPEQTPAPDLTATPTATVVMMTAGQDLSCVKGPHWVLYDWVTRINDGETVTLLARATAEWPDYYYARKDDGTECWAFGGSSEITGDPSSLPEREAPPLPDTTLVIENKTNGWIRYLFLRGKDETAWGSNRLPTSGMSEWETFNLDITAGFYDIQIKDHHGQVLVEKHDIPIGPEPSSRTFTIDFQYRFHWDNETVYNICRITAFPLESSQPSVEVYSPSNGAIAPGGRAWMTLLMGFYTFEFRQCGDNAHVASRSGFVGAPADGGIWPS